MFKNYFKKHPTLQKFSLVAGVILLLLIFLLIIYAPRSPKYSPTLVITPTPSISVTPLPLPSSVEQQLNITWSTDPSYPDSLPIYANATSLVTLAAANRLAQTLGFSEAMVKPSLNPKSKLWLDTNRSLIYNSDQNQIIFSDTSRVNSSSQADVKKSLNLAISVLSNVIQNDNLKFTADNAQVSYFQVNSDEYYPVETTPDKANLLTIKFNQTINGYPLIAQSPENSVVSVTIDSQGKLRNLSFFSGIDTYQSTGTKKTLSLNGFKSIASLSARQLSLKAITSLASQYQTASVVNFNVTTSTVVYLTQNNVLTPALSLTGTVSSDGLPDTAATYLVPILAP